MAEESAGPESLVHMYFNAIKAGDMTAVADNMHPEELSKFKDMMFPIIKKGIDSTNENSDEEDMLAVKLFTRDASIESIGMESPKTFFARFLDWIMILNPAMKDSMTAADVTTIGHVSEGDLAHVVYRIHIGVMGTAMMQTSVMTMKKMDDEWKMMLTGEIEGMSQMLQMNMDQLTD